MKYLISWAFVLSAMFFALLPQQANAIGLKIAPLEYRSALKENEAKKGFVDVSNPSPQSVSIKVSVQAFRQIDDSGGLQFYDDKQISTGITPELTSLDLGPREAIRLFFTIDGKLLPTGDVYAALFFTTNPKQPRNGVGQLVRVGTLLSLVNKNPGDRKAEISALTLPLVQFDDQVRGTYRIKNTGSKNSGFYPTVTVSMWPGGEPRQIESSLVFGGRERANDFTYDTGFGVHVVAISYGDTKKSQLVVTVAPWMVILLLLIILIVGIEFLLLNKRRKKHSM